MSDILNDEIIIGEDEGFEIEVEDTSTGILTEDQEKEIMEYLQTEIRDVEEGGERGEFLDRVDKWRRQREAQPEQKVKNYPWQNASNVTVPIAMTNANGIFALLKSMFSRRIPWE